MHARALAALLSINNEREQAVQAACLLGAQTLPKRSLGTQPLSKRSSDLLRSVLKETASAEEPSEPDGPLCPIRRALLRGAVGAGLPASTATTTTTTAATTAATTATTTTTTTTEDDDYGCIPVDSDQPPLEKMWAVLPIIT